MKYLGIDEAGRGPVIGSMFVAGYAVEEDRLDELGEIGVKDSKKLSDAKRERLRDRLENLGTYRVVELEASEIDELMEEINLNEIELKAFAELIQRFEASKVFVDLPEPDGDRFIGKIRDRLPQGFEANFVAEHGADDEYDVVSAASIIAKSERERHVERLQEKYGVDFASGYPHDRPTINFLEDYLEEHGRLPEETRTSWSTASRLMKEHSQKTVEGFQ